MLESVARGLRSTIHPDEDWWDSLNDVYYDDGLCDYDEAFCPICTYTPAAKDTDCDHCPFC